MNQSKDSSPTNLHMHHPRLADFFEDFTRPHTSSNNTSFQQNPQSHTHPHVHTHNNTVTYGSSSPTHIPSFLPIEEIYVLPQYQPPNPEDEDDVVPDQHAAFGITRAMERRREAVWRDLGLEGLVSGEGVGGGGGVSGCGIGGGVLGVVGRGGGAGGGRRRVVVRETGRLMGGRRTVCLR